MHVVIVDYGTGNLRSVYRALEIAGKNFNKFKIIISSLPSDIVKADKIILPGQGSYKQCIDSILSIKGLYEELNNFVKVKKKPIFGICVGMQLFSSEGYEERKTKGFGWIQGIVKKMQLKDKNLKLPHIGWNNINIVQRQKIFEGIDQNSHFYFVHSYEFIIQDKKKIFATVNYEKDIVSCIGNENIFGSQFHPEKSQENGIKLLANFLRYY
jgi:glutamine amidotransferase